MRSPTETIYSLGAPSSSLRLTLPPEWRLVRPLREWVCGVALAFDKTREFAERCAMCASELMENAVKYALQGTLVELRLVMDLQTGTMEMVAENQAHPEQLDELERVLDKVNQGGSFDSYIQLLSEAAARGGGKSQVGLGRIRAEGNAWIESDRLAPDRVRLTVGVPERRSYPSSSPPRTGRRRTDPSRPSGE